MRYRERWDNKYGACTSGGDGWREDIRKEEKEEKDYIDECDAGMEVIGEFGKDPSEEVEETVS